MGRAWSLLFLLVPILGVACFVCAIADIWPMQGLWFPDNVSADGATIDSLFMFILYLTGAIFIATGLALFYFMWKYDASKNPEPAQFVHGSHTLEVVWSILPAATLLFIAIYQLDAWADAKLVRPTAPGPDGLVGTNDDPQLPGPDGVAGTEDDVPVPLPPLARVTGRQFEWRIIYPGEDGQLDTPDDVHTVNDLHVPLDEPVVLEIESQDVLHSFFLPNLRIKQDVVPGMKQYVWFRTTKSGRYDIVCAELCGWGHYKMKGRLTIEPRAKFDRYLAELTAQGNATTNVKPVQGE